MNAARTQPLFHALRERVSNEIFFRMVEELSARGQEKLMAAVLRRITRIDNLYDEVTESDKLKAMLEEIGLALRLRHARLRMLGPTLGKATSGQVKRVSLDFDGRNWDVDVLCRRVEEAQEIFKKVVRHLAVEQLGLRGDELLRFWKGMSACMLRPSVDDLVRLADQPETLDLSEAFDQLLEALAPSQNGHTEFFRVLDANLEALWEVAMKALEWSHGGRILARLVDAKGGVVFSLGKRDHHRVRQFLDYFEVGAEV